MGFHLIYSRNNFHITGNVDKMIRVKIAHADSSKFSFFICFFQCPVCAVTGRRMVGEATSGRCIRLQLAQALVYGIFAFHSRSWKSTLSRPKNLFALDYRFFARHCLHPLRCDSLRRVNHPITDFRHRLRSVRTRQAKPDRHRSHLGHFNTVV